MGYKLILIDLDPSNAGHYCETTWAKSQVLAAVCEYWSTVVVIIIIYYYYTGCPSAGLFYLV